MVIRFEPLQKRLLRVDAARRRAYVDKVRRTYHAWEAGRISLARLCSEAGTALQDYASETLDALLGGANAGREPGPSAWVLDAYHEGISRAGAAIRDAIADSTARHAVAQTLQERMLRAESLVRHVINSSPAARPRT
jgi:hypothetical protein